MNGKILNPFRAEAVCLLCSKCSSTLSKSPAIVWGNLKFLIVCVQFPERACGAVPGQLLTLFVFSTPGMKHFIVYYIMFCFIDKAQQQYFSAFFPSLCHGWGICGAGQGPKLIFGFVFYLLGAGRVVVCIVGKLQFFQILVNKI